MIFRDPRQRGSRQVKLATELSAAECVGRLRAEMDSQFALKATKPVLGLVSARGFRVNQWLSVNTRPRPALRGEFVTGDRGTNILCHYGYSDAEKIADAVATGFLAIALVTVLLSGVWKLATGQFLDAFQAGLVLLGIWAIGAFRGWMKREASRLGLAEEAYLLDFICRITNAERVTS